MTPEDVPACAALAANDPDCWSEAALLEEIAQPAARVFLLEAESAAKKIAAFCVFQLVLDEASLLAVHTAPALRQKGVATWLLRRALAALESEGARQFFLEVRSQNRAALTLYTRLGFETVGARRGFYQHPRDDAVVMRKSLP